MTQMNEADKVIVGLLRDQIIEDFTDEMIDLLIHKLEVHLREKEVEDVIVNTTTDRNKSKL